MAKIKTGERLSFSRQHIVALAQKWIGTPYHHQGAVIGVGADCLGLLRGVYTDLYGEDPYLNAPMRYSPNWAEGTGGDTLMQAACDYLIPVDTWGAGDVLLFKIKNANYTKHCAITVNEDTMIHAVSGRAVQQVSIGAWSSRVAGAFSFPGSV